MFGGDDLDRASLHGDRRSVMSFERPLEKTDHSSSRQSIISLNEREYGWSTNASGVANARREQSTKRRPPPVRAPASVDSVHTIQPARRSAYRPPFAPAKFDLSGEEDEEGDVVAMPVLTHKDGETSPGLANNLNRGRSIKQRIGDAFAGRRSTGTTKGGSQSSDPPSRRNTISHPPPPAPGSGDDSGSDNWAAQVARRVSRRTTRPKARESEREYDPSAANLGHYSSRLSTYDMPDLPNDIGSIPLYAPPNAAGCNDAPALSSFAPRPPLRPRAATTGDVPAKPAQTVAQAARTYTIKRGQTSKTKETAPAAAPASDPVKPTRYKAGDSASRRSARKPQVVPVGWGTAAATLDKK